MSSTTHDKKAGRSTHNHPQTHGRKMPKRNRPSGSFPFPEVRGKTVADVYVTMDSDMSCVTLRFADNTDFGSGC